MSKKYKLFSAASGGKAPCAFFSSPAGCRHGDACKFSHESAPIKSDPISEVGSVVSSESEPEVEKKAPIGKSTAGSSSSSSKSKVPNSVEKPKEAMEDDPFLSPGENPTTASKKKKNRRGKRSEDHLPFANPKKKAKTEATTTTTAAGSQEKSPLPSKKTTPTTPAFRSLNLPISSFSLPTTPGNKKESKNSKVKVEEEQEEDEPDETSDTVPSRLDTSKLPLPKSTDAGRKWLKVVKATQSARRFAFDYDFDRYRVADDASGICTERDWVKAKPYGKWCADAPQSVAIDCEMCETQDPVSGKKNHKALCRISIVDAETKEVLLDTLVKPAWPVTNYRTFINGIKQEHLEKVQFTIRHAQAFVMALCSEETVILGHAVHNDLVAMRMEHHCVADSACLFQSNDPIRPTVSLKDLAKAIMNKEMPDKHDSVNDALTALACLEHYLEKDGDVKTIERSAGKKPRDPNAKGFEYYASQLLVHRIPKMVDESHLSKLFLTHSDVQPSEVQPIEFAHDGHGKTHVVFQSPRHAELAFEFLQGSKPEPDPSGRIQKKIFLRNKSYIKIRKMAFEVKKEGRDAPRRSSSG